MVVTHAMLWPSISRIHVCMVITLDEYHPIWFHKACFTCVIKINAGTYPKCSMYVQVHKLCCKVTFKSFDFINIGPYEIYLTPKFSPSMVGM